MKKLYLFCGLLIVAFNVYAGCQVEVFDSMLFIDKPDLKPYGLKPIKVVYGHEFFPPGAGRDQMPTDATVVKALTGINDLTVIDIEHWQDMKLYRTLMQKIHRLSPELRVGYYGVVPIRDYWNAIQGDGHPGYEAWQARNVLRRPVAQKADVVFPSLYTFYTDQQGWVLYARANISEAKRYNKAVYAFIWPYYHPGGGLKDQIPADYWRLQLETLSKLAVDGIVIWGGYKTPWDPQAGWWLETINFMADRVLSPCIDLPTDLPRRRPVE